MIEARWFGLLGCGLTLKVSRELEALFDVNHVVTWESGAAEMGDTWWTQARYRASDWGYMGRGSHVYRTVPFLGAP